MRQIELLAKTRGFTSIRLGVFSRNPYSQRLYAKLGCEKTGQAVWRKGPLLADGKANRLILMRFG